MLDVLEKLKKRETRDLNWDWNDILQSCTPAELKKLFAEQPELLEERDTKDSTPLFSLIVWCRVSRDLDLFDVASLLISLGSDVNALHKVRGKTPVGDCGHTPLLAIQSDPRLPALKLLMEMLKAEANLEFAGHNGATPIHFAVRSGNATAIDLLVGAGSNVNAINDYGETPLHTAVGFGEIECALHLLRLGANVFAKDIFGSTPSATAHKRKADCRALTENRQTSSEKHEKILAQFKAGNFDKLIELLDKRMLGARFRG